MDEEIFSQAWWKNFNQCRVKWMKDEFISAIQLWNSNCLYQWMFSNFIALNSFGLDIFVTYKNLGEQFFFSFTSATVTILTEVSPNNFRLSVSSVILLSKSRKPCQVVYQNLRLSFLDLFQFLDNFSLSSLTSHWFSKKESNFQVWIT